MAKHAHDKDPGHVVRVDVEIDRKATKHERIKARKRARVARKRAAITGK